VDHDELTTKHTAKYIKMKKWRDNMIEVLKAAVEKKKREEEEMEQDFEEMV
jgi:hypothetical protein